MAVGTALGALAVGAVGWFLYQDAESERERAAFERRRLLREEQQREREREAVSARGGTRSESCRETQPPETVTEISTEASTEAEERQVPAEGAFPASSHRGKRADER